MSIKIVSHFRRTSFKGKSVTVHERNLQIVATEIYKLLCSLFPEIMKGIFKTKTYYCNTFNAYFPKEILKQLDMD